MNLENVDYSDGTAPRRSFLQRLRGAVLIDASVYEEVEHDTGAMGQTAGVVALVALATGIGFQGEIGFARSVVGPFVTWGFGTLTVWVIGVWLLKHTSDLPELARTLGFALAPQVAFVLFLLPLGPLLGILALLVVVASIAAWVVAARQALDISTGRSVLICVVAYVLSGLLNVLLPLG